MLFRELNRGKCRNLFDRRRKGSCGRFGRSGSRGRLTVTLRFSPIRGFDSKRSSTPTRMQDHRSASNDLKELIGAKVIMHSKSPAPHVNVHVDDGDEIPVGELRLKVLYTPGHTPERNQPLHRGPGADRRHTAYSAAPGGVSFAGGDAGEQFDGITQKLFALPDETLMFPAHDYRGNRRSTIGDEKRLNSSRCRPHSGTVR